jgi:hypothetical protein
MAVVFVFVLGYGAYRALTGAALVGYLGQATQERTELQISRAGSLILGGRPEGAASYALLKERPLGYGLGIAPSPADLQTVKEGMASVGADPNTGYVEVYMLGRSVFEMHSVAADVWTTLGLPGLLLALTVVAVMLRYLGHGMAYRSGTAIGYFLAIRVLWDLGFSPLYSSLPDLMLGIAVVAMLRPGAAVSRRPVAGR